MSEFLLDRVIFDTIGSKWQYVIQKKKLCNERPWIGLFRHLGVEGCFEFYISWTHALMYTSPKIGIIMQEGLFKHQIKTI